jgi:hypothetical protein
LRSIIGTTNIPTPGTRVQVSTVTTPKIIGFYFCARPDNAGNIFVGNSLVASTYGKMLLPGKSFRTEFAQYTVPASDFYADATNSSDKVDWELLFEN